MTEVDPPNLLAYRRGGELLRFELSGNDERCRLRFTHVFDDRKFGAQHATGWDLTFRKLDALLAGDRLTDDEAMEDFAEVHERYAESFGLDPEVGRRALAAYQPGEMPEH